MNTDWLIIGASSPIARAFALNIANNDNSVILVARDKEELEIIASDIRYRRHCQTKVLALDLSNTNEQNELITFINSYKVSLSLFIAHTQMYDNQELTTERVDSLVRTNVLATSKIIHAFVVDCRVAEALVYLSSVAAVRGRHSNSLYGGSKNAIDMYLEGLKSQVKHIKIINLKLGFIDTTKTYGKKGVFWVGNPEKCASLCYKLLRKKHRRRYFPWFWRYIMLTIRMIPDRLFYRMKI